MESILCLECNLLSGLDALLASLSDSLRVFLDQRPNLSQVGSFELTRTILLQSGGSISEASDLLVDLAHEGVSEGAEEIDRVSQTLVDAVRLKAQCFDLGGDSVLLGLLSHVGSEGQHVLLVLDELLLDDVHL